MMCTLKETKYSLTNISTNNKVTAVELALELSLTKIQELVMDFEKLKSDYKEHESQYLTQKEKCESQTCSAALELKKSNETKDNIIQAIASAVTKLCETRDFNTVNEIFSIIYGDKKYVSSSTKPEDLGGGCRNIKDEEQFAPADVNNIKDEEKEEKLAHDESVSEIEGTPTGRKSPIILSKKSRNTNLSYSRDKKKCPENWSSPDRKMIKLSFPTPTRTPNGKMKQTRLNLVKVKPNCLIDLTSSPELNCEKILIDPSQVKIKQEDDDETILPSPSGLANFQSLQKSIKSSPSKFKRPNLSLKLKLESTKANGKNENFIDENISDNFKNCPERFPSPVKLEVQCLEKDADESMSLIQHMRKFEAKGIGESRNALISSPTKRPLVENNNLLNVQNHLDLESSLSILRHNPAPEHVPEDNLKRSKNMEPVYKEPTVRKQAEKRALPGWSCEECKHFYAELYKDNPDMLAKKMDECSKHRGRFNPARPKTPPGYWHPRWDVPSDTEEFNRRNDAL